MNKYLLQNPVTVSISQQKYLCHIQWRNGILVMDEPQDIGGQDLGPDPFTTLLASLASCTLSTLRMYIDRKGWDIPEIQISLNLFHEDQSDFATVITREIIFNDQIDDQTKSRLLSIAEKCPVSKILKNTIHIQTNMNHG